MKSTMRMRYAVLAILVLLIVAAPVTAYIGKDTFGWVVAKKLTVLTGGTQFESSVQMDSTLAVAGAATMADDLAVSGNADITGDTSLTGSITIGKFDTLTAATAITVTNGAAFTPTATYQPIQSASTVTPTITIPSAGRRVCLMNTGSNSIVIADASNQVLSGTHTLGQYDVLCGLSDGTRFIETAFVNN